MTFQCSDIISLVPVTGAVRANRFVEVTANGTQEVAAADGNSVGIARETSEAGSTVAISVMKKDSAIGEIEAGGVIAVGDEVSSGADGVAVSGGANPQGVALTAAAAAGEIITFIYGN